MKYIPFILILSIPSCSAVITEPTVDCAARSVKDIIIMPYNIINKNK